MPNLSTPLSPRPWPAPVASLVPWMDAIAPIHCWLHADLEYRPAARRGWQTLHRARLLQGPVSLHGDLGDPLTRLRTLLTDSRTSRAFAVIPENPLLCAAICAAANGLTETLARAIAPAEARPDWDTWGARVLECPDDPTCLAGDQGGEYAFYADATALWDRFHRHDEQTH